MPFLINIASHYLIPRNMLPSMLDNAVNKYLIESVSERPSMSELIVHIFLKERQVNKRKVEKSINFRRWHSIAHNYWMLSRCSCVCYTLVCTGRFAFVHFTCIALHLTCGRFMDITVAYYHPLLHPEVAKRDFDQIRSAGAGSILYSIHEQEEQRWPRDLERGMRIAQDAGLKVHLSLGRYGNLFAGPTLMPSWYTFRHPQSRVMDHHGRHHEISCFNHQSFRRWLFREIERYLAKYPINGILIDEPRSMDITCFCSVCRALCPDVTDLERFRKRSMIDFLGEICSCAKRVDEHIKTTVVLLPQDLSQVEELAQLPHLDTIGCHLFWNLLNEDVAVVERWSHSIVQTTRHY